MVLGCHVAGKITSIIFGVAGPIFAAILWLSITTSYRQEKAKVVRGVMRHVATADITHNSSAFIGTAHNETQKQRAKDSLKLPLDTDSGPQAGLHPAGPDSLTGQSATHPVFGRSPNIDRAASLGSSIGRSSSIGLLGQLHTTASVDSKATAEVSCLPRVPRMHRKCLELEWSKTPIIGHRTFLLGHTAVTCAPENRFTAARSLCSYCKCARCLPCIGFDLVGQSQFLYCTWQVMSGLV